MKKLIHIPIAVLMLILFSCDLSNSVDNPDKNIDATLKKLNNSISNSGTLIFAPETFTRLKGNPITEQREFTVSNPAKEFILFVQNGGNDKQSRVTSCTLVLNSDTLISPIDIDKMKESIEMEIFPQLSNTLSVRLAGKPGTYLTISITGFSDECPGTVTDIDGNVYQTIQIGDQCWMAEDLRVTHYRNGDSIPQITDYSDWSYLLTGAYCSYNNDESLCSIYGYLYNWYTVNDSRQIAPEGWHVPSDEEWKILETYLGMSLTEIEKSNVWRGTDEGGMLKETGTLYWSAPNSGATNETGFTARPGGYRSQQGPFALLNLLANYWTSTEYSIYGWFRGLSWNSSQVFRYISGKKHGMSVRCVKD